jgi:hypothetical protein
LPETLRRDELVDGLMAAKGTVSPGIDGVEHGSPPIRQGSRSSFEKRLCFSIDKP